MMQPKPASDTPSSTRSVPVVHLVLEGGLLHGLHLFGDGDLPRIVRGEDTDELARAAELEAAQRREARDEHETLVDDAYKGRANKIR